MGFWFFLAAGLLSAGWLVLHLTAGEREIAKPLLQSRELSAVVRETQYLCWHFTSWSIAAMAGFFFSSAATQNAAFAIAGVFLSAGFALIGISLVVLRKARHIEVPQGWLFVPVALLGVAGLFA